jgi:hypothetical protein
MTAPEALLRNLQNTYLPLPTCLGVLYLDRRHARSSPRPRQRRHCTLSEIRATRQSTVGNCTLRGLSLQRDQLLVRLPSAPGDRSARPLPDLPGRVGEGHERTRQPTARHPNAGQVPVASAFGRQCVTAPLSRQPQPGELTHRHTQVSARYPLDIPGSQLHTTTRSHRPPTVPNAPGVPCRSLWTRERTGATSISAPLSCRRTSVTVLYQHFGDSSGGLGGDTSVIRSARRPLSMSVQGSC